MFKGKRVLVLGAARSGIAAAKVLKDRGAIVTVNDITPLAEMDSASREELEQLDVEVVAGAHPPRLLDGVELIVKNPGIPPDIEFLRLARQRGIPWISELELAYLVTDAEIVAVTGTNGKTTTTALAGEIFAHGARPVAVGGNIGIPLTSLSAGKSSQWILVAEVSSFQLEDCHAFHPRVAVYTNITPDHLDRHKTLENYVAAKRRLQQNQNEDDYVVLNLDDPGLKMMKPGRANVIGYSLEPREQSNCYIRDGCFCWQQAGREEAVAPLAALKLPGIHNRQNALAAIAAARAMGLGNREIAAGLAEFKGVEHRLEYVGEVGGVRFFNDSKATNPQSTITALQSFAAPVLLLAGGYDKGADFSCLAPVVSKKAAHVVCYGQTGPKLAQALFQAGYTHVSSARDLAQAFARAWQRAGKGDVILLSPACASWDAYKDFEERGRHFKGLVNSLGG